MHLLIFTVRPGHESLQDFIASARRCGDLWLGSRLVSELSKAAAYGIARAIGPDGYAKLVFPAPTSWGDLDPDSDAILANKVIAVVPEGVDPAEVARKGEKALRARLDSLAEKAFGRAEARSDPPVRRFASERARAQVKELFATTWVAVPTGDSDLAEAYATAERRLAARKRTSIWGQPSWAEDGAGKCSVDGLRDAVLEEPKGERLCGVCTLKRFVELRANPFVDPAPEFAFLVANGDSTGKLLRDQATEGDLRRVSECLSQFANDVRERAKTSDAVIVYAAGADVLALVPVHAALDLASDLAAAFEERLQPWRHLTPSPSLSAGLAVVSASTPLGEALRAAREAERSAKTLPGKNALAISVQKGSGEALSIAGHWRDLAPRLNALTALYRAGEIPGTLRHELPWLERLVAGVSGEEREVARRVQRAEWTRVLARKGITDETQRALSDREGSCSPVLERELRVAQMFARARDAAEGR